MSKFNGKVIEADEKFADFVLSEGSKVSVDYSEELKLPPWADEKKIALGQKFVLKNNDSIILSIYTGLLATFAVPSILNVILFTKQSSTPSMAYRRYMKTGFYAAPWYGFKLEPGTNAWKSLEAVRKFHVNSSKRSDKSGSGMITQKDMAITQMAFVGVEVICSEKLGIHATVQEFDAFVHLWRVLGSLMGIEDRFNLCTDSFEESLRRMESIRSKIIAPALRNPEKVFYDYCLAAFDGIWCFYPRFQLDALFYFTKRMIGVPGYHFFQSEAVDNVSNEQNLKALGWFGRFNLISLIVVHEYFKKIKILQVIINIGAIMLTVFLKFFPIIAIWKFGVKKAFIKMKPL